MATVYVLNQDGNPMMPTTRCGHVRFLLKQNKLPSDGKHNGKVDYYINITIKNIYQKSVNLFKITRAL